MKILAFTMVAAAVLSVGCRASAAGPPAIELDRTACSECGMLVSEPVFAAASRDGNGQTRVFDDVRCLRKAHASTGTKNTQFWFHDARDASWIDGQQAVFVEFASLQTPMAGGLLAFRDRATADAEAAARHGRVVGSIRDVLREAGGGR
jgi:copper chaperone NosL